MKNVGVIITLLISLLSNQGFAQDATPATGKQTSPVGEVFLKGSVDGKSLFMVLGMEKALEMSKDAFKDFAFSRSLEKYKQDAIDVADLVVNEDHDNDYVEAVNNGVEQFKATRFNFYKRPWKSLERFSKSYKANFQLASESYYNSKNATVGALKYSGIVAWAQVQGAYYLIIQMPVNAVIGILEPTALSVPLQITLQTAELGLTIVWDFVVKPAFTMLKTAMATAYSAVVIGYSAVTAGSAAVLTMVASGGVAVVHAGEFIFAKLPSLISFPIQQKVETNIDFQTGSIQTQSEKLVSNLRCMNINGLNLEKFTIQSDKTKVGPFKANVVMADENGNIIKVKVRIQKKKLVLNAMLNRKAMKTIRNQTNSTKSEIRENLKNELTALVENTL